MKGRVLIAAGSDSGGGAGIQADIKTVTALGGYAATAITALTAQDTRTVHSVHPVPADFVAEQMRVVLADIGADCIKTGMLHSVPIVEAVAETLARHGAGVPLVVDPVLVAKGGAALLEPAAMHALATMLIGRADLATPQHSGGGAADRARHRHGRRHGPRRRAHPPPRAQGGPRQGRPPDIGSDHRPAEPSRRGRALRRRARIESRHTHGTGCTLAAAIATGIAQGMPLVDAVDRARRYLRAAIEAAPGYGAGHGPLNHGVTMTPKA